MQVRHYAVKTTKYLEFRHDVVLIIFRTIINYLIKLKPQYWLLSIALQYIFYVYFVYRECVALQDPHCAWDSKEQQCSWVGNRQFPNPERFLQNIESGKTDICNKLPALLASERHNNRSPATKKPTQSEPNQLLPNNDIQNEILIEVVETNVLSEDKSSSNNKHETGKFNLTECLFVAHYKNKSNLSHKTKTKSQNFK